MGVGLAGRSFSDISKFAILLLMIFTDSGIILLRQDFREADRMVSLYTREHGRIHVRLPGVARAAGKFRGFDIK